MGAILHMQTEIVRETANQIELTSRQIEEMSSQLSRSLFGMDWVGPSRDEFAAELEQIIRAITANAQTGLILSTRVVKEVDEWETLDGKYTNGMPKMDFLWFGIIPGLPWFIPTKPGEYPDWMAQRDFNATWKNWSLDERKAFFQEQYNKMTEKYGLKKVDLVYEDLDDSKGDFKGQYRNNENKLVIDIDNMNSAEGYDTFSTLAHETRHQIQFTAVQAYREHGEQATFPPGVSVDQAKAWSENIENYIKPETDFEGYQKQPVEADARDFGDKYIKEYAKAHQPSAPGTLEA